MLPGPAGGGRRARGARGRARRPCRRPRASPAGPAPAGAPGAVGGRGAVGRRRGGGGVVSDGREAGGTGARGAVTGGRQRRKGTPSSAHLEAELAAARQENAGLRQQVEEQQRRLTEALEQQTATAEVLGVIAGRRPTCGPVLDAVVENTMRLCGADDVVVFRVEGAEVVRVAARGPIVEAGGLVGRAAAAATGLRQQPCGARATLGPRPRPPRAGRRGVRGVAGRGAPPRRTAPCSRRRCWSAAPPWA